MTHDYPTIPARPTGELAERLRAVRDLRRRRYDVHRGESYRQHRRPTQR